MIAPKLHKDGFSSITSSELVELQRHLLDLLLEFDGICKKHNITYYLDGGSVIGALRHKGFIPWDDDVDILIKKADFDKFMSIISAEMALRSNRAMSYMTRKTHHHRTFARYVDTAIPHVLRSTITEANYLPGIFLDIFILDSTPSKYLQSYLKTLEKAEEWFHKWLNGVVGRSTIIEYWIVNRIEKIVGERKIFDYYNKRLGRFNHLKPDHYIPRNGFNYAVYDADVFQEPVYVEFEGHMLPAPTKPEKYLRGHYSTTWFNMPPPDQRQSVHYSLTTKLFTAAEFVKRTNWVKERDRVHKLQETRHFFQILRRKWQIKKHRVLAKQHGILLELELAVEIRELMPHIAKLQADLNHANVLENAAPFLAKQKTILGAFPLAKVALKVDHEFYHAVLNAMVMTGRYYDAANLASLPGAPKISDELRSLLVALEDLECAMQDKEHDRAVGILRSFPEEMSWCPTVATHSAELGLAKFPSAAAAIDRYERILMRVGNNYEIWKMIADLQFENGQYERAEAVYKQIIAESSNGITIMGSREKLSKLTDMKVPAD